MKYLLISLIILFPIVTTPAIDEYKEPIKIEVITVDKTARVTCYAPTGYRTASMKDPTYGMVASSDRTIPLGTQVYIEGYGIMTVEDRTAKWVHEKKGFTLDVFMEEGCDKHFGVKRLSYVILK